MGLGLNGLDMFQSMPSKEGLTTLYVRHRQKWPVVIGPHFHPCLFMGNKLVCLLSEF